MAKKQEGGKSAEDGEGKGVSQNSLLGRAISEHRNFGERLAAYGQKLDEIALQHEAGKAFERLVSTVNPESQDELASRLLSLVVFAALEAGMHAPFDVVEKASEAEASEAGKLEIAKPEGDKSAVDEPENSRVVQARRKAQGLL